MPDAHKLLDAAIQLAKKSQDWTGGAVAALEALHERLFPGPHEETFGSASSKFASLSPEQQATVDEFADSCKGD